MKRIPITISMKAWNREDLLIQTKCGIVPGVMYDFSYDHIMQSVEGSLKRLDTGIVKKIAVIKTHP